MVLGGGGWTAGEQSGRPAGRPREEVGSGFGHKDSNPKPNEEAAPNLHPKMLLIPL